MEFDGKLISELGAKKYLRGHKAQVFSNINPLQRQDQLDVQWQECNFGCHTPSFRVLRKSETRSEFLASLNKRSPIAAGLLAGVEHQSIRKVDMAGSGLQRTAEGLGMAGREKFSQVGEENVAIYSFVRVSTNNLLNTDIRSFENPLCKLVFSVVYEYIRLIPEWVVIKALNAGALHVPEPVNKQYLTSVASQGLIESELLKHIDAAFSALKNRTLHAAGKNVGKEIAKTVAAMIATKISQKIMQSTAMDYAAKRRVTSLRKSAKSAKGGIVSALSLLLNANGMLGIAARDSREVQSDCPKLWRFLRYQCNGLDMLLFLVRDCIQEYLDRISILERNPETFMKMMAALIRAGKTKEIFLPA